MGGYISFPLLALAAVLQATFVPQVRILGGGPDLVFLLVFAWSVNTSLEESVVWAFVGGIMQDLLSAAPLGASTLGLLLIVFGVNGLSRQLYGLGIVLLMGLVLVASLANQIVYMIVLAGLGFTIRPLENLTYVVLPTVVYNSVLFLPTYFFVRLIHRRIQSRRMSV